MSFGELESKAFMPTSAALPHARRETTSPFGKHCSLRSVHAVNGLSRGALVCVFDSGSFSFFLWPLCFCGLPNSVQMGDVQCLLL